MTSIQNNKIVIIVAALTFMAAGNAMAAGSGKLDNLPELYTVYVGPTLLTLSGKEAFQGALLFGGLGAGFAVIKAGKKMVKDYSIEDPMISLRSKLASNLKKKYSIKKIYGKNNGYKKSEISNSRLKKRYGDAVVLKLKSRQWWLSDYVFAKKHFYLKFLADAEIVSVGDGNTLWKGKCKTEIKPKDKKKAPSIQKLRENDAALFKTWMTQVTTECANQMSEDIARKL